MESKTAAQIRQLYLDYFEKNGHTAVPSASLIPAGDPSLLFTNSGMVPFKDTFLGKEERPYNRAVSAQRCVRAGGKHNDLENVGYTARHHTFFEMLGNFSFGDYFKQQAIVFAWELITEKIGLAADKLWITVHYEDKEAAEIWHKEIGIPKNRIAALDEDNFWQMGDTGPCGPCSEIFYDHGDSIEGDPPGSPNEGDRYVEVWNLVFMQFNRSNDGVMTPLPKPSVDTGMGLERIAAVLQGVHNNYDTDLFTPLLNLTNELCHGKNKKQTDLASQRIIADHIRSSAFLIADGINPSNEGRGYVLRRIIRRALRHGNKLKIESPFFHKLVAPLVAEMGQAHPLIGDKKDAVIKALKQEEEKFNQTLEQGLALLNKEKANISGGLLDGAVVFKLYDTYGFPPDLTEDIGREEGFRLDWDVFKHKMEEQRKRSRSYSMFQKQEYSLPANTPASEFVGYDNSAAEATVITLLDENGKQTDKLEQGQDGVLVLDKTPFYAESGGQIGDQGRIICASGIFAVLDTQKQDAMFLHFGKMEEGALAKYAKVRAQIDATRRDQISKHHTATHLLHSALHKVIGEQAQQRGSRVADDSLRLDFSHDEAMSREQLEEVEDWVNERIRAGLKISTTYKSLDEAKREGAMALFGEKYAEKVRVVDIPGTSKELCGGNHCEDTRQIQEFIILKESSISSGVRRIEAVVADKANIKRHKQKVALNDMKLILAVADENALANKLSELVHKLDKQEKEMRKLQETIQLNDNIKKINQQLENMPSHSGISLMHLVVDDVHPNVVNKLADLCRAKMDQGIVVIANQGQGTGDANANKRDHGKSESKGRNGVLITASKNLSDKYPASELMKYLLSKSDGSGGGNPTRAQGGIEKIDHLEKESARWIEQRSKS